MMNEKTNSYQHPHSMQSGSSWKNHECVIVVPAYNEEGCIEKIVRAWHKVSQEQNALLLVVNDGSRDRTREILDRLSEELSFLRVIHQDNAGHGVAIMRGYREALETGCTWIFQTDSDDQFSPKDFERIWEKRNKAFFVIGYRKVRHDAFADRYAFSASLHAAYTRKDKKALRLIAKRVPAMINSIANMESSFRTMWLNHNKPQGLETIQARFGMLNARYHEIALRLGEYINGTVKTIPELD